MVFEISMIIKFLIAKNRGKDGLMFWGWSSINCLVSWMIIITCQYRLNIMMNGRTVFIHLMMGRTFFIHWMNSRQLITTFRHVTFFRTFLVGKLLIHFIGITFFITLVVTWTKARKPLIGMFRAIMFLRTFLIKILLIPLVGITFFITLVISIFLSFSNRPTGWNVIAVAFITQWVVPCVFLSRSMSICNVSFVVLTVIFIISISVSIQMVSPVAGRLDICIWIWIIMITIMMRSMVPMLALIPFTIFMTGCIWIRLTCSIGILMMMIIAFWFFSFWLWAVTVTWLTTVRFHVLHFFLWIPIMATITLTHITCPSIPIPMLTVVGFTHTLISCILCYYRKFIPCFADISRPLAKLTGYDVKWNWCNKCDMSFQMMKNFLTSIYPGTSKLYTLFTDGSKYGWAGVLTQKHTSVIDGKKVTTNHPVFFVSG